MYTFHKKKIIMYRQFSFLLSTALTINFSKNMVKMFPLLLCLISACSNTSGDAAVNQYDQQKEQLERQEHNQPLSFLSVASNDKKNWLGKTVVKGKVANTASVSSYKDVRIKLLSYHKDGRMLEEHEDVIGGVIKPNTSKDFKLRYRLPKGADSIALSIMSATVVE